MRILVLENNTASVLADYSNLYNTPSLRRQPGSTIKPFVGYAPALEKKLVFPMSVLQDERTDFGGYSPKNFADTYYGDVTVADSLKLSLNVPAVKLTDMCGLAYAKATANKCGIPFSSKDTGLSVALGGLHNGTTLTELADAYATLARDGVYMPSKYIREIQIDGKTVYTNHAKPQKAIGDDTAFLLTDMLTACAQSGTAKKLHNFSNVAAKTGTVERGDFNSDAYCIAYTPHYTVAVWYGDPAKDKKIYGGQEPAALAAKVLQVLGDTSRFTAPDSVVKLAIDRKKLYDERIVYLASPLLPKRYTQDVYFSKANLPKQYSYPDTFLSFPFFSDSTDFDNFEVIDSFLH